MQYSKEAQRIYLVFWFICDQISTNRHFCSYHCGVLACLFVHGVNVRLIYGFHCALANNAKHHYDFSDQ